MRATAYLHSSKESMYELGQSIGLKDKALDYFIYTLYEVKFELEVNPETGESKIVSVDGKPLQQ